MNDQPLSQKEYEQLFRFFELIGVRIDRLLSQGVVAVDESLDDERIDRGQTKIDGLKKQIQKTQQDIQRFRKYVRHKQQFQNP